MQKFVDDLRSRVLGAVKNDEATHIVYRVNSSIFSIEPLAVFHPLSREDILIGIKVAKDHGIAIIPRGAATGITGGCLGRGLVVDLSKNVNRILTINIDEGFALVEPGVVQDDLNRALAKHGYRLGPETSTGNRATLGGMLANNAAGSESLRFGSMVDHILEVELATAKGRFLTLKTPQFPLKIPMKSHKKFYPCETPIKISSKKTFQRSTEILPDTDWTSSLFMKIHLIRQL